MHNTEENYIISQSCSLKGQCIKLWKDNQTHLRTDKHTSQRLFWCPRRAVGVFTMVIREHCCIGFWSELHAVPAFERYTPLKLSSRKSCMILLAGENVVAVSRTMSKSWVSECIIDKLSYCRVAIIFWFYAKPVATLPVVGHANTFPLFRTVRLKSHCELLLYNYGP